MSLINKVLTDLDRRGAVNGNTNSQTESEPTLNDLRYTQVPANKSNKFRYGVISSMLVVIAASGIAGFYLFHRSANENIARTAPSSVPQTEAHVSNKPAQLQDTKKIQSNQIAEHDDVINSTMPVAVNAPANKVSASSQAVTVKAKPKKASPVVMAKVDNDSAFNKNIIPMRSEQRAEVAYQSAYDYLRAKNTHKAERSLRSALALEPSHIKARELLSGVYIKQGRWVEASELLRNGLSMSPGHLTFSKLYARALMQLKQDKVAIDVLQKHAPRLKSDPDYYAILAALYQRQKDHVSAAETYQKIVEIQPRNGVWWVGLGISLEALGKAQQAGQAYRQARKSGNLQNDVALFTNNRLVALDEIGYPTP